MTIHDPHHTEYEMTAEDRELGRVLSHAMGDLHSDAISVGDLDDIDSIVALGRYFYRVANPQDTWTRIARALRVNNLRIISTRRCCGTPGKPNCKHQYANCCNDRCVGCADCSTSTPPTYDEIQSAWVNLDPKQHVGNHPQAFNDGVRAGALLRR